MTPVVPSIPVLWAPFLATICLAAAMDVCYVSRGSRENCHLPSYARQIVWWVLVGILFGGWVVLLLGWSAGASWSYGYFLEYMLSVDNLFVFQLVFKSYATPESHVEGALFWGIAAAILLRLGFFGVGTSLLAMGFVSRLVFGVLLIYSGIKAFWDEDKEEDPRKNLLVRCVARHLPLHDRYTEEPIFFLHVEELPPAVELAPVAVPTGAAAGLGPAPKVLGMRKTEELELHGMMDVEDASAQASKLKRLKVTPLFLVVLTLAVIDVIFAVDSVTAKVSSVHSFDPSVSFFLNLSSSAFAMFVLRSLYLVVDLLTQSFRFLKYGVGVVLVFIGLKLILSHWVEVSMSLSSLLIVSFLICSIVVSYLPCCKDGGEKEDTSARDVQLDDIDDDVFVIGETETPGGI